MVKINISELKKYNLNCPICKGDIIDRYIYNEAKDTYICKNCGNIYIKLIK